MTVFGTPGVDPWGWRWEGHHLSRRFNVINGKLSVTPFFLGAWPTVNNAGLKAMAKEKNITVIDLHDHYLNAEGKLDKKYTVDGLHLNAAGLPGMEKNIGRRSLP